jgi:acyl-CoA thioester hydrolase
MQRFPLQIDLQVRYKDVDSYGHVNNAVYVTYFEEARVAFFREVFGVDDANSFGFIVARIEVDYRRPVKLFDALKVGLRVESIGTTSFVFGYQLSVGDEVVASGRSVQVCFDYQQQKKVPVPESFREKVRPYLAG